METEKKMDKKPRTGLWSSHNLNEESLTDTQIDFLMSCFEQNLEHARHVENERLTFNSIYMALVGGVLAFVYSTEVKYVMFSVVIVMVSLVQPPNVTPVTGGSMTGVGSVIALPPATKLVVEGSTVASFLPVTNVMVNSCISSA